MPAPPSLNTGPVQATQLTSSIATTFKAKHLFLPKPKMVQISTASNANQTTPITTNIISCKHKFRRGRCKRCLILQPVETALASGFYCCVGGCSRCREQDVRISQPPGHAPVTAALSINHIEAVVLEDTTSTPTKSSFDDDTSASGSSTSGTETPLSSVSSQDSLRLKLRLPEDNGLSDFIRLYDEEEARSRQDLAHAPEDTHYDDDTSGVELDYHGMQKKLVATEVRLTRARAKAITISRGNDAGESVTDGSGLGDSGEAFPNPRGNRTVAAQTSISQPTNDISRTEGDINDELTIKDVLTQSRLNEPTAITKTPSAKSASAPSTSTTPTSHTTPIPLLTNLSFLATHTTNRIRHKSQPPQFTPVQTTPPATLTRMALLKTAPYISRIASLHLSKPDNHLPFDILQGLVRASVYKDPECSAILLRIQHNTIKRPEGYTMRELRVIRKGYLMLDLACLADAGFADKEVVECVRRQFFGRADEGARLEGEVFRSVIHVAVEKGVLPKMAAVRILFLCGEGGEEEGEVEKEVFGDEELFGPGGCIWCEDGETVDRAKDVRVYDWLMGSEEGLVGVSESSSEMVGYQGCGVLESALGGNASASSNIPILDIPQRKKAMLSGLPKRLFTAAKKHLSRSTERGEKSRTGHLGVSHPQIIEIMV